MALSTWRLSAWLVYSVVLLSGCVMDLDAGGTGGHGGAATCGGGQAGAGGQGGTGGQGGAGAGGQVVCVPDQKYPCYTGPVETLDVGQCQSGSQTCNADGTGWGPCEGEVLPAAESCLTAEDEDCDGAGTCPGGPCTSHADCPSSVCVFSTGVCSILCSSDIGCGQGQVCNGCATASCPACADCLSACVPAPPGACDNHDDCPSQHACLFETGTCVPLCLEDETCADPGLTCHTCATSSCPDCNDCVTGCLAD